jgi:hypothetical protein
MAQDCSPCYDGRPEFEPSAVGSVMPQQILARSRLFNGGTLFRSNLLINGNEQQGIDCNSIALEVISIDSENFALIVYYNDVEVERYTVFQDADCGDPGAGGDMPPPIGVGIAIPQLRIDTANSGYISMPTRGTDEQDATPPGPQPIVPSDDGCLSTFSKTPMSGASGLSAAEIPSIRTGPDRTLVYISSKEDANGEQIVPLAGDNIVQYNYDTVLWIPYVPDADCRPEGTDC